MNLTDFFVLASVVQGLILGVIVLVVPRLRSRKNNYLAASILLLCLITFLGWQDYGIFWLDYLWSLMWEFLLAALLFHYFLHALDHAYLRSQWLPLIYAPFLFILFVDLTVDLDFEFGVYRLPFTQQSDGWQIFDEMEDVLSFWYNAFMVGWSLRLSLTAKDLVAAERNWLVGFSSAMLLVIAVWFFANLVNAETDIDNPYGVVTLSLALLFWWIAYAGVYRLRILDEQKEINRVLTQRSLTVVNSKNADSYDSPYTAALNRLMDEQRIYRNPDLSRQLLAEQLGISEGYVSQVIRASVGETFVDYVNRHRVRAATEILSDPEFANYSLEAIGREAGFRSRSAFYGSFKATVGMTPGAYRKQQETS